MSNVQAKGQHFYGHLLTLQDSAVLLPKQAMIEAVSMETLTEADGPEWFLGFSNWQGSRIPAISLEAMMGGEVALRGRRSRVAIINSVGTHLPEGLFAIMTMGYPHLLPLNPAAVQPSHETPSDEKLALAQVRLANREAFVPDLEEIERRIAEYLSAMKKNGGKAAARNSVQQNIDSAPLEEWEPEIDLGLPD